MTSEHMNHAEDPGAGCGTPVHESWHAATIHRMIHEAPPFRARATPGEIVAGFAHDENRWEALLALHACGPEMFPVRRGR